MIHLYNWTKNIRSPMVTTFKSMKEARNYLIGYHYEEEVNFFPAPNGSELVFVEGEYSYALCPTGVAGEIKWKDLFKD